MIDIRGSVATTSYFYDGAYGSVAGCQPVAGDQVAGRMTCINQHLAGTGTDQAIRFAYNAANQAIARTTSNDGYAWTGHYNVNRPYTTNGLNQYSAAGPAAFTYDANANLISDGSSTYGYDSENKLVSASGAHTATLTYDPMGRLFQVTGGSAGPPRFLYDGDALVAEYDARAACCAATSMALMPTSRRCGTRAVACAICMPTIRARSLRGPRLLTHARPVHAD